MKWFDQSYLLIENIQYIYDIANFIYETFPQRTVHIILPFVAEF